MARSCVSRKALASERRSCRCQLAIRGRHYHSLDAGDRASPAGGGVFSIDTNRRAGHALLWGFWSMISWFFRGRVRVLTIGVAVIAALAASSALATAAGAASAPVSCKGISFKVLHNDQSGGVILPEGSYTVSSPNLGCSTASNYFTTFLNKYNYSIPGWKGAAKAKGWGTYIKNGSSTQFTVMWSKAKAGTTSSCATSALKVALGPANGAAGTVFYPINFVNMGKVGCTLRGYPGVSAVTSSGKQIGSPASQISSSYQTVTLVPGKAQSAVLGIVETGNFDPSHCAPATAAGLKVFPPGQTKAVTIKKSFSTCSSTTVVSLTITPVK